MAVGTILTIVPLLAAMMGSALGGKNKHSKTKSNVVLEVIKHVISGSPIPLPDLNKAETSPSEIKLTWLDEQTLEMRLVDNSTDNIILS